MPSLVYRQYRMMELYLKKKESCFSVHSDFLTILMVFPIVEPFGSTLQRNFRYIYSLRSGNKASMQ